MMIATEKATGRDTAPATSAYAPSRARLIKVLPASAAMIDSKITIGPSTKKPKSIAPRLIRSPVMSK